MNLERHASHDGGRMPGRSVIRSAMRLALAAGLTVAVVGTGLPFLQSLRPEEAQARGQALAQPMEGFWRTYANGDRILGFKLNGDEIWSATDGGGVVRWRVSDGTHRQYLAPQDGLQSNIVQDVEIMGDGTVWAATQRGLGRYISAQDRFETLTPANSAGMPSRVVTALAANGDGRLWVGFAQEWDADEVDPASRQPGTFTKGGLALFDPATGAWDETYNVTFGGTWNDPSFKYVPSENVMLLEMASDGTLWIGTVPYYVWDANTCTDTDCPEEDGFWVQAGGGLAAMKDGAWQTWFPSTQRAGACYSSVIRDLAAGENGHMWVAAGDSVMLMRDGFTKIGCDGQVRYERSRFKGVGLRGTMVWSVDVDDRGRVWVGSGESYEKGLGLAVLDHNGTVDDWDSWDTDDYWEFIDLDNIPGRSYNIATSLQIDADGRVVVGTRDHKHGDGGGLRLYDPRTGAWTALRTADTGLAGNQIADVQRHPTTGDIWVSMRHRGVSRFDGTSWQSWRMFAASDHVASTQVDARRGHSSIPTDIADHETFASLFPPESNYVRFGTDTTLYRVTGFTIASHSIRIAPGLSGDTPSGTPVFAVDRGPAGDNSTQIAFGADGDVWIGGRESVWTGYCGTWPYCWLDGGLGRWNGERWLVYDFARATTNLPERDNEVQTVAVDASGKVWAGTGNPFDGADGRGIFVYDPAANAWSLIYTEGLKARDFGGDGVADIDRDPATGDMWTAHHSTEVCANNSPFGEGCQPSFTGGGVSQFNGTEWRKWTKRAGAFLKGAGLDGDQAVVFVDRSRDRVWSGGYDMGGKFHWLQGIDVNAVLNWCPIAACSNESWQTKTWPGEGVVSALQLDELDRLWVGVHRFGTGITPPVAGVKMLDGDDWFTYTPENSGMPSNEITSLTRDDGGMWIGTRRDGIALWTRLAPPTPTPPATSTPRVSATWTPGDEPTPTVGTAGPSPTDDPAATAVRTATPTPTPSSCLPGEPCPLYLPFAYQRKLCKDNCVMPVTPAATSDAASATPTRTTMPSATPSPPPSDTATTLPSITPSSSIPAGTNTPGDSPTPDGTNTPGNSPTPGNSRTPTRTTVPTVTPSPAVSPTAQAPAEWKKYSAVNFPRTQYWSVFGLDASNVWITGDESNVWHWDGATWTRQRDAMPDDLSLRRVFMYTAVRGYLIGNNSAWYETRNGGELWRRSGPGTYVDNWRAISVIRGDRGYVGWLLGNDNGNRLYWEGDAWAPQGPADRNNRSHSYSDLVVLESDLAYAISDAATGSRIYSWNGEGWSPGMSTVSLYDMDVLSAASGVAVGRGGAVYTLDADGWDRMPDGPRTGGQDLYAVDMVAENAIWAAGGRGKIYFYDGESWSEKTVPGQVKGIRGMWMSDTGTEGWAVGDDGLFLRYE